MEHKYAQLKIEFLQKILKTLKKDYFILESSRFYDKKLKEKVYFNSKKEMILVSFTNNFMIRLGKNVFLQGELDEMVEIIKKQLCILEMKIAEIKKEYNIL